MQETTTNRTAEMIKWLSDHPNIQRKLCLGEYEAEPEECLVIMGILEKRGYYEMIYVLLTKNQQHAIIGGAMEKLLAELWADKWEKAGNQQMCKEIQEHIQNEIALRELKRS